MFLNNEPIQPGIPVHITSYWGNNISAGVEMWVRNRGKDQGLRETFVFEPVEGKKDVFYIRSYNGYLCNRGDYLYSDG